jgi:hypothetical protein
LRSAGGLVGPFVDNVGYGQSLPIVEFSTLVTGVDVHYQWRRDGVDIPGATDAVFTVPGATSAHNGTYTVVASSRFGTVVSLPVPLTVKDPARLINLSVRSTAGVGDATLIVGFAVDGSTSQSHRYLVRGMGPTLATLGVPNVLADPSIALRQGQTVVATNDDWADTPGADTLGGSVGAFPFHSRTSRDAALIYEASPAVYTVMVSGKAGATGTALAEMYEAPVPFSWTAVYPQLLNVSARTMTASGDGVLTAGFFLQGDAPGRLLIRAVGPGLAAYGVGGTVTDPVLKVFRGQTLVATNDDWSPSAEMTEAVRRTQAFPLQAGSKDAAMILSLDPGGYSVQAVTATGEPGIALVEVYLMP